MIFLGEYIILNSQPKTSNFVLRREVIYTETLPIIESDFACLISYFWWNYNLKFVTWDPVLVSHAKTSNSPWGRCNISRNVTNNSLRFKFYFANSCFTKLPTSPTQLPRSKESASNSLLLFYFTRIQIEIYVERMNFCWVFIFFYFQHIQMFFTF
jgi:hypothetical protein